MCKKTYATAKKTKSALNRPKEITIRAAMNSTNKKDKEMCDNCDNDVFVGGSYVCPNCSEVVYIEHKCKAKALVENIWTCKIGGKIPPLPYGADAPLRDAIYKAFLELTGVAPDFLFSGWGGTLTESERAVAEDRDPEGVETGLLLCPFCGSSAAEDEDYGVYCTGCGIQVVGNMRGQARQLWNTRSKRA